MINIGATLQEVILTAPQQGEANNGNPAINSEGQSFAEVLADNLQSHLSDPAMAEAPEDGTAPLTELSAAADEQKEEDKTILDYASLTTLSLYAQSVLNIVQPQTAEPAVQNTTARNTEVESVVFPAGFKTQDEIKDLITQALGLVDNDDFFALLEKYIPEEGIEINNSDDMRSLLNLIADAVASAKESENTLITQAAKVIPKEQLPILLNLNIISYRVKTTPYQDAKRLIAAAIRQLASKIDVSPPGGEAIIPEVPPTDTGDETITTAAQLPPEPVSEDVKATPMITQTPETTEISETQTEAHVSPGEKQPVKETPVTEQNAVFNVFTPQQPVQNSGVPPQNTVEPAEVINQISDFFQTANLINSEGVTKLEMQLNPENLGSIEIVLESKAGEMAAIIKPANNTVREALTANVPTLTAALKEMGINMQNITVEQPNIAWDFSRGGFQKEQRERQNFQNQNNRRINTNRVNDTKSPSELFYGTGALDLYADGTSSIILRA